MGLQCVDPGPHIADTERRNVGDAHAVEAHCAGSSIQTGSVATRAGGVHQVVYIGFGKRVLAPAVVFPNRIIKDFAPSVFVMENVKGMLSSQHAGASIFDRIISDLRSPGNGSVYLIRSIVVPGEIQDPSEFVIRSEELGIPQKRHRVILFGIRSDIADAVPDLFHSPNRFILKKVPQITAGEVLDGLPALRRKGGFHP